MMPIRPGLLCWHAPRNTTATARTKRRIGARLLCLSPVAIGHTVVPYQRKKDGNRRSEPPPTSAGHRSPRMTLCVVPPGLRATLRVFLGTVDRVSPVAQPLWTVRVWTKPGARAKGIASEKGEASADVV